MTTYALFHNGLLNQPTFPSGPSYYLSCYGTFPYGPGKWLVVWVWNQSQFANEVYTAYIGWHIVSANPATGYFNKWITIQPVPTKFIQPALTAPGVTLWRQFALDAAGNITLLGGTGSDMTVGNIYLSSHDDGTGHGALDSTAPDPHMWTVKGHINWLTGAVTWGTPQSKDLSSWWQWSGARGDLAPYGTGGGPSVFNPNWTNNENDNAFSAFSTPPYTGYAYSHMTAPNTELLNTDQVGLVNAPGNWGFSGGSGYGWNLFMSGIYTISTNSLLASNPSTGDPGTPALNGPFNSSNGTYYVRGEHTLQGMPDGLDDTSSGTISAITATGFPGTLYAQHGPGTFLGSTYNYSTGASNLFGINQVGTVMSAGATLDLGTSATGLGHNNYWVIQATSAIGSYTSGGRAGWIWGRRPGPTGWGSSPQILILACYIGTTTIFTSHVGALDKYTLNFCTVDPTTYAITVVSSIVCPKNMAVYDPHVYLGGFGSGPDDTVIPYSPPWPTASFISSPLYEYPISFGNIGAGGPMVGLCPDTTGTYFLMASITAPSGGAPGISTGLYYWAGALYDPAVPIPHGPDPHYQPWFIGTIGAGVPAEVDNPGGISMAATAGLTVIPNVAPSPYFVSGSAAYASGSTNVTIPAPAGLVVGNMMYCWVGSNGSGTITPVVAGQWTAVAHFTGSSGGLWLFTRTVTSSEPSTYVFTGCNWSSGAIVQYTTGAETIDSAGPTWLQYSTATVNIPGVTFSVTGGTWLACIYTEDGRVPVIPPGFAKRAEAISGGGDGISVYDQLISPAGATGNAVTTLSSSDGGTASSLPLIAP